MKLIDMTLTQFGNEVDSNSPAPGGGSVAAYGSHVGVSLARMMANLSFGKKKYEANEDSIKEEFKRRFDELEGIRSELLELVDKDTESFNEVMKAMKLPKETDEEKNIRSEAIEEATWGSIEVPFKTAKVSLDALRLMEYFVEYGNQNAITDLGVGSLMTYAGLEGAIFNVEVNLGGAKDIERAKSMENECKDILKEAEGIKRSIVEKIHKKLAL